PPGRFSVADSRECLHAVFLYLLPPASSVAQWPPVQCGVDELQVHGQGGGKSRDPRNQGLAMRFTGSNKAQHWNSGAPGPLVRKHAGRGRRTVIVAKHSQAVQETGLRAKSASRFHFEFTSVLFL